MSRSLFASKRAKFLLALWVAAGGVLFVDRVLKRTHWIGSTKFELKLVVTDAETGQPIDKATLHVYSEGEWEPGDGKGAFRLETDAAGTVKRVWENRTAAGVSGWNVNTFSVPLPPWVLCASAPGYSPTKWVALEELPNARQVDGMATLTIQIPMQRAR